MPTAQNGSIELHYESSGRGPAVLLIAGLAMPASGWWRTVSALSRSFRVLTFDHRGVGDSDTAAGFYSIGRLASDAVAVLDAARVRRAHVYGISLGGMIAQELALDIRHRLAGIAAPTLVTHGERDRVVPCENARILTDTIPGAELKLWPDAGHLYPTDEPKADRHVARFLRDHGDGKGLGTRLREALPVGA